MRHRSRLPRRSFLSMITWRLGMDLGWPLHIHSPGFRASNSIPLRAGANLVFSRLDDLQSTHRCKWSQVLWALETFRSNLLFRIFWICGE